MKPPVPWKRLMPELPLARASRRLRRKGIFRRPRPHRGSAMRPTPPTGFEALKAKGVTFTVTEAGTLSVQAPPGVPLPPETAAALEAEAPSIVQRLRQSPDLGGWPAEIAGLGPLCQGAEGPCEMCGGWTRVSYGTVRRCRPCAWDPATAAALGWHRALVALWDLVRHEATDPARLEHVRQELVRWQDEVGVTRADHLARCLARIHWQATGRNPWSGQPDPDRRWLAS
jgi:hypothetical protein